MYFAVIFILFINGEKQASIGQLAACTAPDAFAFSGFIDREQRSKCSF